MLLFNHLTLFIKKPHTVLLATLYVRRKIVFNISISHTQCTRCTVCTGTRVFIVIYDERDVDARVKLIR